MANSSRCVVAAYCVVALGRHALCRPRHQACLAATSTEAISCRLKRVCEVIQSSTTHPILCFGAHPHTAALARTDFHKVCVWWISDRRQRWHFFVGHPSLVLQPRSCLAYRGQQRQALVASLPAAAAVAVRSVASRRGVRGDFPGLWRHSSARQCLRTSSVERLSTRTSPSRLARALLLVLVLGSQRHSSRHRQSL